MPGAFAHMTLVNMLKETNRMEAIKGFPKTAMRAVMRHFKFCELGAVSPDYPYLCVGDRQAAVWADKMHYDNTGDVIKNAVTLVRAETGETQLKALAWLLGYSAHVAMDVTIHPVVELKVGTYAENKKAHRVCEMNQDAYIFNRLNLGGIGLSEHLDSGIQTCATPENKRVLDPAIVRIWSQALNSTHPIDFQNNPPEINKWHNGFSFMVDEVGEEGNHLFPLARHIAVDAGLTYPRFEEVKSEFLQDLETPNGPMHYDDIFNKAVKHASDVWKWVATGVLENNDDYLSRIDNWNLDTGRNQSGNYVFWG
jgi:hypothetical protein